MDNIDTLESGGKYEKAGQKLGRLVDNKQAAYGDAISGVEDILKILYPQGIKPEEYRDLLLIVRIEDKICRIARGVKEAFGESPFRDIAGYGILGAEHGRDENAI